jgi:hypothetical protein
MRQDRMSSLRTMIGMLIVYAEVLVRELDSCMYLENLPL